MAKLPLKLIFFALIFLYQIHESNLFIRVRLPRIRLPRIRIPPVRLPRIRIPPIRLPRIRIPPIRIPLPRIPPIRIPPIRKIIRTIGEGLKKAVSIFKGCCGLHPSICRNEKRFKNIQKDIKAKSAEMDKEWKIISRRLNYTKLANADNSMIYQEVKRITLKSQTTIEILDPEILVKMNNVSNEMKKAIRFKNQTVMNYGINQIEDEYDKEKTGTQTALLDASGIGGFGMTTGYLKMTADMFRMMKLDMVANFLESDVGGFLNKAKLQVSKLFGFHYLEKLGKQNKILGGVLKAFTFYNNYLSLHGGVFKLMEGFNKLIGWITDLATCKSRGNKISSALKKLEVDYKKILKSYTDMKNYKTEVNKNWNTVREQILSEGLTNSLDIIQDIARQSSSSSAKTKKAMQEIQYFKNNIRRANEENTVKIQNRLLVALKDITYTVECYEKKLATYQAIVNQCKRGEGSFDELYARAQVDFKPNSAECKGASGLPYTTKTDVHNYLKEKAKKEKFEINCLLNSGVKRALTCQGYYDGYTNSQISSRLDLDMVTVTQYLGSCPAPELSPRDVKEICDLRKDSVTISKVYDEYKFIDQAKVRDVYFNSC